MTRLLCSFFIKFEFSRGYAVVMINPRGSTGFGTAFTDAVRGDWGGAPYRDIMNGVQYITAKYPQIDYQRMCACGGSYGGFVRGAIFGL
jgi:dipeptidyl aminopeptidase/acylaminoacyl peptidase